MLNGVRMAGAPIRAIQGGAVTLPMVYPGLLFGQDAFQPSPKTGIVASIGPASNNPETIEKLILAGVGVFRINFATGTHGQHGETVDRIREVAAKLKEAGALSRPVRIMADLEGPRIAVGTMPFSQGVAKGDTVKLSPARLADAQGVVPTTYPELVASLQPGNRVIVADGQVILQVTEPASDASGGMATCKVVKGGMLSSNQMINAPDAPLKTPPLTEKDIADLEFALSKDIEIITQSYPGSADDVRECRRRIQASGKPAELIAKIERPQTVEPAMLKAIAEAADGIMVARGDLATETGINHLPRLQQRIIDAAKAQGKFVVVANKLLGSMVDSDQPSRSDVFDVTRAVESGADWLMLTAETASGKYPVEAVETAAELIRIYSPQAAPPLPPPKTLSKTESLLENIRQALHKLLDQLFEQFSGWLRATLGRFGKPA